MYFQPLEGSAGAAPSASLPDLAQTALASAQTLAPNALAGDAISRFTPPWLSNIMGQNPVQNALFPFGGVMGQLMQMLQSMMSYLSSCGSGEGGSQYGGEQYFGNATGASTGDPHLSFNGNHWNSMVSQPDLLNSDSIPGGFGISTQVTPPNANGVTWNQSATVSLDGGQTHVSLDNTGQPSIMCLDRKIPIAQGQTVNLGNGQSVTYNQNGSLTVLAQNGFGGQIQTTLAAQGQGVNVNVNAQNVDLGGALVSGSQQPVSNPIGAPPVFGPITGPIFQPPVFAPPISDPIQGPIGGQPFPIANPPRLPVMHPF